MRRFSLIALALALTARAGAQQPAPDLILHHARIYTANDARPEAAALAWQKLMKTGDVMTEPTADILTMTVVKTMIGGRWVYGS